MKITAIKQQVRQAGRYSIFVEGKYAFSLSDVGLLNSKLVVGQALSPEEIKSLKQTSVDDKLLGKVLRYAMMRPRSEWEITAYLKKNHSPAPLQEKILNKLRDNKVLDDGAFARSWVASRRLLKPVSRRRLIQELLAKHVSSEIIDLVLAEDSAETSEQATLKELVERKRRQTKYQDNQKLMQYLARQGFSYDDIKAVVLNKD